MRVQTTIRSAEAFSETSGQLHGEGEILAPGGFTKNVNVSLEEKTGPRGAKGGTAGVGPGGHQGQSKIIGFHHQRGE